MPQGYDHAEERVLLGEGEALWQAAKLALQSWEMIPAGWVRLSPKRPVRKHEQLVIAARLLGIWWLNPVRIIDSVAEEHRFGFAYGTLPGHLAQGEERFLLERDAEGKVWYSIRVMSRPVWWGAKLLSGFARRQQARFRKESLAAMKRSTVEGYMGVVTQKRVIAPRQVGDFDLELQRS
jgi:uncharacterized protein (UPF0548 family)